MQDVGFIGFLRPESNTFSLLSAQSHNPSELDSYAVKNFAAFIYTRRHVGITYYPGPANANVNICAEIHAFSDGAEGQHLGNEGHLAWLIKNGLMGIRVEELLQRILNSQESYQIQQL